MNLRPNVEKVLLEKIQFALRKHISDSVARNIQIGRINPYEFIDSISDEFVIEIRGFLWGEDLGEVMEKYPEDWKQAFKERWYPQWLLKKYPVKYKVFRARQKVAYPNLDLPSVKNEETLYFLQRA